MAENPFVDKDEDAQSRVILYLSKLAPAPSVAECLVERAAADEEVVRTKNGVWIYFPADISRSKLTPGVIDKCAGSPATGRNWKTLRKLQGAL